VKHKLRLQILHFWKKIFPPIETQWALPPPSRYHDVIGYHACILVFHSTTCATFPTLGSVGSLSGLIIKIFSVVAVVVVIAVCIRWASTTMSCLCSLLSGYSFAENAVTRTKLSIGLLHWLCIWAKTVSIFICYCCWTLQQHTRITTLYVK